MARTEYATPPRLDMDALGKSPARPAALTAGAPNQTSMPRPAATRPPVQPTGAPMASLANRSYTAPPRPQVRPPMAPPSQMPQQGAGMGPKTPAQPMWNFGPAFQQLLAGDPLKAWGQLGMGGKWGVGLGGGALLMLLLSRLFGKQASYTPAQVKQAQDLLDRMAQKQAAASNSALGFAVPPAAGPYGSFGASHYTRAPIGERKPLAPEQEAMLQRGEQRWLPKIFSSMGDSPDKMMASPLKTALLTALLTGTAGAVGGGLLGGANGAPNMLRLPGTNKSVSNEALGGLIGGGLGAGLGGLFGYASRNARNEDIRDAVSRHAPGATRRDLLSDPLSAGAGMDPWSQSGMGQSAYPALLALSMLQKQSALATAPRYSRMNNTGQTTGPFTQGNAFQGSRSKKIAKTRATGADAKVSQLFDKTAKHKRAVHVEEGGPISRVTASTLGRANPLSLLNLIMSRHAYSDPSRTLGFRRDPEREKAHRRSAELLDKAYPEELKDTVLRLGGTNIVDDLIWKKERGESLPWYKKIGGRIWHNPQTSLLGKMVGTAYTPLTHLATTLMRASHYNMPSDAAVNFANEPAFTEHELGHAVDNNNLYGLKPGRRKGFRGRIDQEGRGLARDLYMLSSAMPGLQLLPEARANQLSHDALKSTLGEDSPEYREKAIRRSQVLPAAYGSYIGGNLPVLGLATPVAGMLGGKALGMSMANELRSDFASKDEARKSKATDEEPERKKAASHNSQLNKEAFLAWGGGKASIAPKGFGVGGELGYTNLLGLLPIPMAGLDIGGPNYGMMAGVMPDPESEIGVSPYLGARLGHPRPAGARAWARNFPRGLPEVIYDKLRGRTKMDALRRSYPELFPALDEPEERPESQPASKAKSEDTPASSEKKALDTGHAAIIAALLGAATGAGANAYHNAKSMSISGRPDWDLYRYFVTSPDSRLGARLRSDLFGGVSTGSMIGGGLGLAGAGAYNFAKSRGAEEERQRQKQANFGEQMAGKPLMLMEITRRRVICSLPKKKEDKQRAATKEAGLLYRALDPPSDIIASVNDGGRMGGLERYQEPRLLAKPFMHGPTRQLQEGVRDLGGISENKDVYGAFEQDAKQQFGFDPNQAAAALYLSLLADKYPKQLRWRSDGPRPVDDDENSATEPDAGGGADKSRAKRPARKA